MTRETPGNTDETRSYLSIPRRREMLVAAALEVLTESGPDGLSLRAVAEHAGVAHRTVSYVFGTKTELVRAVLLAGTRAALEEAWRVPMNGPDLRSAIGEALAAYTSTLQSAPRASAGLAALTAFARMQPEYESAVTAEVELAHLSIGERVDEWTKSHPETPVDRNRVVHGVYAAAEGLTSWWLSTGDERRLADVIDAFATGIAATAQENPQ